jgi:hypothetical protein
VDDVVSFVMRGTLAQIAELIGANVTISQQLTNKANSPS